MKLKTLFMVVWAGVLFAGCSKKYLDINTNPNNLTGSTADVVFTSGANRVAAIITPNELGEYWSGHWTQSSTYIYDAARFSYNFNNTNFNFWDTWYDVVEDFQYVINSADATGFSAFKGPAKVMKAYVFQQIVDCYGNAPYSDAFKGNGSIAPKFDDQKAIYDSLIVLLDAAITDLRANAFVGAAGAADIIFKGNTTNWIRFANSLKLRILIRESRVPAKAAYIVTEINKAAAAPEGFLAIGQDVRSNPGYQANDGQTNPIYANWGYLPTGAVQAIARFPKPTTFFFNQLKANDDTFRLKRFAYAKGGQNNSLSRQGVSTQPEIVANYVGVPYGSTSGYLAQNTSYPGPSFIIRGEFDRDVILMTASESFFLLAEAKQVFPAVTLTGTPQTYYEQAVKESFRVTGATAKYGATVADALLTNGKDLSDWNASPDKLKLIWQQKWIALNTYSGLESWSEFRRTNFPVLPASAGAPIGQKLPLRLFYPSSEAGSNTANVDAQGSIDVFTTRIFWDVE
ncbi:MAG: SusD/RagB family nutrient-binding outer membrane lipoprotein [Ferruginibacter sp.]